MLDDMILGAGLEMDLGNATLVFPTGSATIAVTPEQFGAIGDGVHDDTLAWNRAVASGYAVVAKPGRTYKCGTISVGNASIDCRWARFICTASVLFLAQGSVTASVSGADYVANADYSLPNEDDYTGMAFLRSSDNIITTRTYYRGGFATLFEDGVCSDKRPIGFTGVTVDKISPVRCEIRNVGSVTFATERNEAKIVKIEYGCRCVVDGIDVGGDCYSAVEVSKSIGCFIRNAFGRVAYGGNQTNSYPISLLDSSRCVVENDDVYSEHWVAATQGGDYLCYDNVFRDCVFGSASRHAIGGHDCAIGTLIDNCDLEGGSVLTPMSKIRHSRVRTNGTRCDIIVHAGTIPGICHYEIDDIEYVCTADTRPSATGIYVSADAQTSDNQFYVDSLRIHRLRASDYSALAAETGIGLFAMYITVAPTLGNLMFTGEIDVDDCIGILTGNVSSSGNAYSYGPNCRLTIRNCNSVGRIRSGAYADFYAGNNSFAFPSIVEVRDSLIRSITGLTTGTLHLRNVTVANGNIKTFRGMSGERLIAFDTSDFLDTMLLAFTTIQCIGIHAVGADYLRITKSGDSIERQA